MSPCPSTRNPAHGPPSAPCRRCSTASTPHLGEATELRRRLHADPRLSGEEDDTTATLVEALGLPADLLPEGGALRVGGDGPAIGVRAGSTGFRSWRPPADWQSANGAMHAWATTCTWPPVAVARTLQDEGAPMPMVVVPSRARRPCPLGAKDVAGAFAFTRSRCGS